PARLRSLILLRVFFSTDTATTKLYTLSLHDALPIFAHASFAEFQLFAESEVIGAGRLKIGEEQFCMTEGGGRLEPFWAQQAFQQDRKSTRLNSSHDQISYAVFCLKKKKKKSTHTTHP